MDTTLHLTGGADPSGSAEAPAMNYFQGDADPSMADVPVSTLAPDDFLRGC